MAQKNSSKLISPFFEVANPMPTLPLSSTTVQSKKSNHLKSNQLNFFFFLLQQCARLKWTLVEVALKSHFVDGAYPLEAVLQKKNANWDGTMHSLDVQASSPPMNSSLFICSNFLFFLSFLLALNSLEPNHGEMNGGTLITVHGNQFDLVNFGNRRQEQDLVFQCIFGDVAVPATITSPTTITCTTPAVSQPQTVPFRLTLNDFDYTDSMIQFTFTNCIIYETCQTCSLPNLCGWCLEDMECKPSHNCASNWTRVCPSLQFVSPGVGSMSGGERVTLVGSLFISHPEMTIHFGENATGDSVQVINSTAMSCNTPQSENGTLQVTISLLGRPYVPNSVDFTFIEDLARESDGNDDGLTGGVIGAIVAAALIAALGIGAAIAIVIAYRRQVTARRIVLVDPKYDEIAFGNFLGALYSPHNKKLIEELAELEELLLAGEKTLVVGLSRITGSTESDALAKAVVYLYEGRGKAMDLIFTFIEIELASGDSNTVFRQNSLATKMFKFYSKLVGIEYLFQTLARYVAELEASTKIEDEGNQLINTTIEIEIDPTKLEGGDENVNIIQLMIIVQKLFNTIIKSAKTIPA
jgi:hypothetical protein